MAAIHLSNKTPEPEVTLRLLGLWRDDILFGGRFRSWCVR